MKYTASWRNFLLDLFERHCATVGVKGDCHLFVQADLFQLASQHRRYVQMLEDTFATALFSKGGPFRGRFFLAFRT